jgi:hypothetical protein
VKRERFDREEMQVIKAAVKGRIRNPNRAQGIIQAAVKKAVRVMKSNVRWMKDIDP